jgi:hypothetical protein
LHYSSHIPRIVWRAAHITVHTHAIESLGQDRSREMLGWILVRSDTIEIDLLFSSV